MITPFGKHIKNKDLITELNQNPGTVPTEKNGAEPKVNSVTRGLHTWKCECDVQSNCKPIYSIYTYYYFTGYAQCLCNGSDQLCKSRHS